jgi:hypothetical protein
MIIEEFEFTGARLRVVDDEDGLVYELSRDQTLQIFREMTKYYSSVLSVDDPVYRGLKNRVEMLEKIIKKSQASH